MFFRYLDRAHYVPTKPRIRFHSFLRYTSRYIYEERPASARIMRAPALALAFLVLAVVLTPPTTAEDWGAVGKVNKLISVRASPELAPGESGRFEFYFNSTYSEPMVNVTLNASIYRYATIDESVALDAQWNLATSANATNPCTPPACRGNVNLTVLGVDGLLSDSAFGVKEPIPRWPFYLLIGLAALFLVLAFLFWVEENPGSYPRVDAWWARTRGRLARTIAPLRRRRPPKA